MTERPDVEEVRRMLYKAPGSGNALAALNRLEARLKEQGEAQPETTVDDWKDALELAHLWQSYWTDEPVVHMHTGKVGFLARSFLALAAVTGIISQPRALSADTEAPK